MKDRGVKLRYALTLLLFLVPEAIGIVWGGVRERPPSWDCGDVQTEQAAIDSYRAGLHWVIAAGEAVAIVVFMAAVRAATNLRDRELEWAVGAVAGAFGVAVGSALLSSDLTDDIALSFFAGLAVTLVLGLLLHVVARGRRPKHQFLVLVGAAVGLLVVGWPLLGVATYAPTLFGAVIVGAAFWLLGWLFIRLGRGDAEAWRALAIAAAFVAVVLIPGEAALIFSRGHGPFIC